MQTHSVTNLVPADQHLSSSQAAAPLKRLPPILLLTVTLYDMKQSFGQFASIIMAVSPPSLLPNLSLLVWGLCEKQRSLWRCTSSFSGSAKTLFVINTGLVTNLKQSTSGNAMKKINSFPARPSASIQGIHSIRWCCWKNGQKDED